MYILPPSIFLNQLYLRPHSLQGRGAGTNSGKKLVTKSICKSHLCRRSTHLTTPVLELRSSSKDHLGPANAALVFCFLMASVILGSYQGPIFSNPWWGQKPRGKRGRAQRQNRTSQGPTNEQTSKSRWSLPDLLKGHWSSCDLTDLSKARSPK